MKNKHTPAAWKINGLLRNSYPDYCRIKGNDIGNPICIVIHKANNEHEANAKLIAAAPELLEALQAIKEYCKYWNIQLGSGIILQVDESIKKATE